MLKALCRVQRTIVLLTHDGTSSYNVRTKAGSPAGAVDLVLTVHFGVIAATIDWGTGWAAGSTFKLVNLSYIVGDGGLGGSGTGSNSTSGFAGFAGSHAMRLRGLTVSIDNGSGYILGGGGGGAGHWGYRDHGTAREIGGGGGGGGQGPNNAVGGDGYDTALGQDGYAGTAGSFYASGVGQGGGHAQPPKGGDGGGWGQAGQSLLNTSVYPAVETAGGAPGAAIMLEGGAVVWIAGNNASQVKGVVA